MLLATAGPSALWYLTRSTGAVALILLSASMVLGIAGIARLERRGWPRFVVQGVHRNISLLALTLLVVHIVTTVLDPFAGISIINAVIPFTGSYRPLWLGLGALASDLLLAIAITSVVRRRLGAPVWRAVHWLSYLCWPVAVVHTFGTGSDVKQVWLLALTATCIAAVIAAVWVRAGFGWPSHRRLRGTAVLASVALPAALVAWLPSGPLGSGWARRAGTPAALLAKAGGGTSSAGAPAAAVGAFDANVTGTISQTAQGNGLVSVDIALSVQDTALSAIHVQLIGRPAGGGVAMTQSSVSAGTSSAPQRFTGTITALRDTDIAARVSSSSQVLTLELTLQIDPGSRTVTGTAEVSPNQ
ncbi:MAG TPA: ferric reductase-like transmembrane domain-containing protein [Solirubrobacteraceae bacterium]|jgi:DMSO/TMAO reductase YedYZ heme-binding membrane subunit|nr:ferric reductase-like transmembrane domain-containing protein [Solirubrobacteraceae bacterium]